MAAPLFVGYEAVSTGSKTKSQPDWMVDDKAISRQLDELERISLYERDKILGRDYFREIESFYQLEEDPATPISFRPRVTIPQLQTLVLNEATDITDASPKIYIMHKDQRDREREKHFQEQWRDRFFNNRILESFIWAMLSNLGFLQVGFNPRARRGKGATWVAMREPKGVFPDPYAKSDRDWSWIGWEDWPYIDEIYREFPEKGRHVRPHLYMADAEPFGSVSGALEFPEASPLSSQGTQERKIFRDNRVRKRTFYLFDSTRERVRDYAGADADIRELVHPRFQYKYPNGRWITECEGVVLADGNNWCPQLPDDDLGTFPLLRIPAMPTITNFWGPPPIKLTRQLQSLSERLYTQLFENVVRTNNGVIVMKNNTGLDPTGIGWLPGEVLMINQGSDPPVVINPQALPQHMLTLPATLLGIQKELQGYNAARQGQGTPGNTSAELFDATLWQSQPMTRLRGRMLAEELQRLASMIFYIDARYRSISDRLMSTERGEPTFSSWDPIGNVDDYEAQLDEGSLQVLSAATLRSIVSAMGKANLLPTRFLYETLGLPNAEELAEERTRELELSAMGKLRRPR